MTISTTTLRNSYSGNGSTTAFAYTYPINTTSEITVIERSALGVETVKAEGTGSANYGIADNGAAGGTITMVTAPAAGTTLIILRNTSLTQETDYVANDPFPAETHEDALDKLQMQNQELQEELDRSIKISRTNTMTSTEFTVAAADRASKVLAFDSSGEISVTQELGNFKGSSATTTTAAFVQRDIVKATTTAQLNNIYICVADSAIGDTLTDTDHFALLVDAVSAAASATTATTKASEAATSASTATTKAAEAVTARDASVVAKDASVAAKDLAVTAKNEAVTAKNAAETALDSFDDLYLGAKSSAPSVDNDGDALTTGDQYFNSSTNKLNVWNGSAWIAITTPEVTLAGTETLTNKILTSPVINSPTGNFLKIEGTNFTDSLLVGHATTGTLNAAIQNTGVGIDTLDALTSGDKNTAVGYGAGGLINSGANNTAMGNFAAQNITTGQNNTYIGQTAGGKNVGGNNNVGIGGSALYGASGQSNSNNTAIGLIALMNVTTGDNNIGVGYGAGDNITSGDGNVIIGSINADSATGDKQLIVADGVDGSVAWIKGDSSANIVVGGTTTTTGLTLGSTAVTSTAAELNVLDALDRGSIIYGNASGVTAVLNNGSNGQFLTTDGTDISWGSGSDADFSSVGEHVLPSTDDTYDLGSASKQWRNIYTGDLHLSNESKAEGNVVDGTTGNWTIQEGAEELYILNNKSGKKYKFNLTEV